MKKLENYFYNVAIAAIGSFSVYLLQGFVAFQLYAQAPWPAKLLISIVVTLMFFIFIMWLKTRAIANERKHPKVAKAILYPSAVSFLFCDIQLNVNYISVLFLQPANHYGEGWTLTSRIWHITKVRTERDWRYRLAIVLRKLIESVDALHFGGKLV